MTSVALTTGCCFNLLKLCTPFQKTNSAQNNLHLGLMHENYFTGFACSGSLRLIISQAQPVIDIHRSLRVSKLTLALLHSLYYVTASYGQKPEKPQVFRVRFARQMSKRTSARASSAAAHLDTRFCSLRTLYHKPHLKINSTLPSFTSSPDCSFFFS